MRGSSTSPRPQRLTIVLAPWCPHCVPLSVRNGERLAQRLGIPLRILDIDRRAQEVIADRMVRRYGDWSPDYLIPQVFLEWPDGRTEHVLTGFSERVPGPPRRGGTSSRAIGSERSRREVDGDDGSCLSPRPASHAGLPRRDLLPPLRPPHPGATGRKPTSRHVANPRLPLRCGVRYLLHRVDPARSHPRGAANVAGVERPAVPGPPVGPPARDSARPRARTGGRTVPRPAPGARGRAGRLLAGLPVPGTGRHRTPPVRLSTPWTSVPGLLHSAPDRQDMGLPRVQPPGEGRSPTSTLSRSRRRREPRDLRREGPPCGRSRPPSRDSTPRRRGPRGPP